MGYVFKRALVADKLNPLCRGIMILYVVIYTKKLWLGAGMIVGMQQIRCYRTPLVHYIQDCLMVSPPTKNA